MNLNKLTSVTLLITFLAADTTGYSNFARFPKAFTNPKPSLARPIAANESSVRSELRNFAGFPKEKLTAGKQANIRIVNEIQRSELRIKTPKIKVIQLKGDQLAEEQLKQTDFLPKSSNFAVRIIPASKFQREELVELGFDLQDWDLVKLRIQLSDLFKSGRVEWVERTTGGEEDAIIIHFKSPQNFGEGLDLQEIHLISDHNGFSDVYKLLELISRRNGENLFVGAKPSDRINRKWFDQGHLEGAFSHLGNSVHILEQLFVMTKPETRRRLHWPRFPRRRVLTEDRYQARLEEIQREEQRRKDDAEAKASEKKFNEEVADAAIKVDEHRTNGANSEQDRFDSNEVVSLGVMSTLSDAARIIKEDIQTQSVTSFTFSIVNLNGLHETFIKSHSAIDWETVDSLRDPKIAEVVLNDVERFAKFILGINQIDSVFKNRVQVIKWHVQNPQTHRWATVYSLVDLNPGEKPFIPPHQAPNFTQVPSNRLVVDGNGNVTIKTFPLLEIVSKDDFRKVHRLLNELRRFAIEEGRKMGFVTAAIRPHSRSFEMFANSRMKNFVDDEELILNMNGWRLRKKSDRVELLDQSGKIFFISYGKDFLQYVGESLKYAIYFLSFEFNLKTTMQQLSPESLNEFIDFVRQYQKTYKGSATTFFLKDEGSSLLNKSNELTIRYDFQDAMQLLAGENQPIVELPSEEYVKAHLPELKERVKEYLKRSELRSQLPSNTVAESIVGPKASPNELATRAVPSFNKLRNGGLGQSSPSIESKSRKVRAELRLSPIGSSTVTHAD